MAKDPVKARRVAAVFKIRRLGTGTLLIVKKTFPVYGPIRALRKLESGAV
jgi:hypothetical protein